MSRARVSWREALARFGLVLALIALVAPLAGPPCPHPPRRRSMGRTTPQPCGMLLWTPHGYEGA